MPLNYLKRFRYTLSLKFGSFIPSPSNFWSTYVLLGVSWPTRNIQLILVLFKCQIDFPRHFYVLSLEFIFKGKGSNMPLNYSKGLDIPPFKVWSIYTLASNFWSTYALMGVSWSTQNIQLNLLFFKCQMGFHIIYIYYYLTFILKEKGVTYALTIRPNFKTHIRPSFKWFNYAPNPTHICVNYFVIYIIIACCSLQLCL